MEDGERMSTAENLQISATTAIRTLELLQNTEKAKILAGFFKTGKGEYGEGDEFLGITVPESRKIAKKYTALPLSEIFLLLQNKIHECRLVALLILIEKFKSSGSLQQKEIVDFYLRNTKYINNWDLVDLSADKIIGAYLFDKDKTLIHQLTKSNNLWERRIAIISTFYFIKKNKFNETIQITELLLNDKHDLIHKAVGWMLREVGKRNKTVEEEFLKKHYKTMPRTMLRYAIEKFPEEERKEYLKK